MVRGTASTPSTTASPIFRGIRRRATSSCLTAFRPKRNPGEGSPHLTRFSQAPWKINHATCHSGSLPDRRPGKRHFGTTGGHAHDPVQTASFRTRRDPHKRPEDTAARARSIRATGNRLLAARKKAKGSSKPPHAKCVKNRNSRDHRMHRGLEPRQTRSRSSRNGAIATHPTFDTTRNMSFRSPWKTTRLYSLPRRTYGLLLAGLRRGLLPVFSWSNRDAILELPIDSPHIVIGPKSRHTPH